MEAQHKTRDFTRPIYFKSITADVVIDDTGRVGKMYFAGYGNKDAYGDILLKGCCAKSIQEHGPDSTSPQKIALLWQHDAKNPLGRPLVMKEDDTGLYVEFALDPIPEADRALIQLKSGTINQGSIGFQYVWDKVEYDELKDAWVVGEIKLFEVSLVTIGANENTPFIGFKAADLLAANQQVTGELEKALTKLTYVQQIELRQLISKSMALATMEPGEPTPKGKPTGEAVNWELIKSLLNTNF